MVKVFFKARNKLFSPLHIIGILAFVLLISSNLLRPSNFKREDYFIAPPKNLIYFTFGYNEVLADLFWIRSIQDFDYCEQKIDKVNCKGDSWLYKILDVVTDLSPKFRMAHALGPVALSIIISDISGASKMFDKAIDHFPNDWSILGRAAYHAMYEEGDRVKAARLLKRAAENGGPFWYYALSGRMFAEGGEMELGESLLNELIESKQPKEITDRLKLRLEEYKKNPKRTKLTTTE